MAVIRDPARNTPMISIQRERQLNQRDTGNDAMGPYLSRKQDLTIGG